MPLVIQYTQRHAWHAAVWLILVEVVFAVGFVLIHIVWPERAWGPLRPFFNLDHEESLSTWFSTIQLFAVGAVLFLAAANNRRPELLSNFALVAAGLVFVFLSADEAAHIHENLTYLSRHLGLNEIRMVGEWNAWIILYAALGLVALVVGAKHVAALWRNYRTVALVAFAGAAIFVAGAVGFEIASYPFRGSEETEIFHLVTITIEEFLEMAGVTVMLYAALLLTGQMESSEGDVHFHWKGGASPLFNESERPLQITRTRPPPLGFLRSCPASAPRRRATRR